MHCYKFIKYLQEIMIVLVLTLSRNIIFRTQRTRSFSLFLFPFYEEKTPEYNCIAFTRELRRSRLKILNI